MDYSDSEDVLEEMEESQRQRLESQLESVEDILENRERINESLVSELDEEIRRQRNRLEQAHGDEAAEIRDALRELYQERRRERRSNWQDRESWLEQKLELEEKLAQIEELDQFSGL